MSHARRVGFGYAGTMESSRPVAYSELTDPLFERFGIDLTLVREGDRVRWCYADSSAVIEAYCDDAVAATFISGPVRDGASGANVHAVYAASNGYALTERGVRCMVDDLAAFFSGVREPRFTFVDVQVAERGAS